MSGYAPVLTASPIQTSEQSFSAIALTVSQTLYWPKEGAPGQSYVADLMDVTPNANGYYLTLPDARSKSLGPVSVISNLSGSYSFGVKDNAGSVILTVAPGTVWFLYLRTNVIAAGSWASFQFGAQAASFNVAAAAGSGIKAIGTSLNQSIPVAAKGTNYSAVDSDRAKVILWTGGAGTLTLPAAGTVGTDWFIQVKNGGTGALVVSPPAGTIDGSASVSFGTTSSAIVFTDGTNYFTIGLGQSAAASAFDYLAINIGGTGAFVIAGAQLNRISYKLTGVLTGNRTFTVPATVQQYWINNQTTGAFSVTVSAGGVGQVVAQGSQALMYCDGVDIIPGQAGITLPLAIASGGTGATTAAAARTNLGSTAVGDLLFTAASAAAARAAIGSGAIGDAVFAAATVGVAVSALTAGQTTVDGNKNWVWLPPTIGTTAQFQAPAGGTATHFQSAAGNDLVTQFTALAVKDWQVRVQNAGGHFQIYDANLPRFCFFIDAATGQVKTYEPSFSVAALAAAATYASGTFTGTLTGCTTAPTQTFYWVRSGPTVTIYCPGGLVGASNSTGMTVTGVPPALYPARVQELPVHGITSSGGDSFVGGCVVGYTANTLIFSLLANSGSKYYTNPAGFANDGLNKGLTVNGLSFTYSLV